MRRALHDRWPSPQQVLQDQGRGGTVSLRAAQSRPRWRPVRRDDWRTRELATTARPDREEVISEFEEWMSRFSLTLGDLNRDRVGRISRMLSLKLDGTPLAAATANRYRTNCHDCVVAAVEAGAIQFDPWPRRSRSQSKRKVTRTKRAIDVRRLPTPAMMTKALDAVASGHPGSRTYQVMTATAYYAGLRPSEVIMLRVRAVSLPAKGWGRIEVTEADIDWDEPGEPKTGPRSVPHSAPARSYLP